VPIQEVYQAAMDAIAIEVGLTKILWNVDDGLFTRNRNGTEYRQKQKSAEISDPAFHLILTGERTKPRRFM
jgi:hypothetical protein